MEIICCKCGEKYDLGENIFEYDKANHPILICPYCNFKHIINFMPFEKEIKGSKHAVLHYSIKKKLTNYYLLEINLETGRHHQIRSQLSKIGSPIKGDLKYGFARSNKDAGISLHSRHISFVHPVTKNDIEITAPLPQDAIWDACL